MPGKGDTVLADGQDAIDAMSRAYEAVNRRDFAAMAESFDPDLEWRDAPELPGAGTYRGPARIVAEIKSFLDIWEEFNIELEEVIPVDDRAVAVLRFHVRGRGSKVPLDGVVAHLWTWRDGKAVRMQSYLSREQALEAAGLQSRA